MFLKTHHLLFFTHWTTTVYSWVFNHPFSSCWSACHRAIPARGHGSERGEDPVSHWGCQTHVHWTPTEPENCRGHQYHFRESRCWTAIPRSVLDKEWCSTETRYKVRHRVVITFVFVLILSQQCCKLFQKKQKKTWSVARQDCYLCLTSDKVYTDQELLAECPC